MPRAVVKWIECTTCGKWRKVGLGIDVDLLPDNWRCNMNNWDLARANCSVPEETDDKSKNESGGSGLFSGVGAYKKIGTHDLSYRQLIYTYYKQTTATFRKKLALRGTNEFKKSFAYHDADDEIEEITGMKKR